MKREIRQVRIRRQIELELKGTKYQLWRLDDTEYQKLRANSLPIDDDYKFYLELDWDGKDKKDKLNLAKVFITLEWLFGVSSDLFADGKSSFCFPILLIIEKPIGTFYYLMLISDYNGILYYRIYRTIESNTDDETQSLRETTESEFPQIETNCFLTYLHGYLAGSFEIVNLLTPLEPFMRNISSNLILYGYKNDAYFQEKFDDAEMYKSAVQTFQEEYGSTIKQLGISEVLKNITRED